LGVHELRNGVNPLRDIYVSLFPNKYTVEEDVITPQFEMLNAQELLLLLTFAHSLIEEVANAQLSQLDK
jgi:hypothetical protein